MADAKMDQDWNHTSEVLALIANANRDPKKRREPFTSDDFHPLREKKSKRGRGIPITGKNIELLRALVPKHRPNPLKPAKPFVPRKRKK